VFGQAELAEAACLCERYCGTQSGGMDQAISIMGARGLAKLVSFHPVRAVDVRLPPDAVFVVANSLAASHKAVAAHTQYNARVVECRLAALALALQLGSPPAAALQLTTLRQVEALAGGREAAAAAAGRLAETYTREALEGLLGTPLAALFAASPASLAVLEHAAATGALFPLRARAAHVFSEAARVDAFAAACAAGAPLEHLGALMDASHASCRDAYACSCPELETLVAAAKARGALGARLTGAGWGGCAVMLLRRGSEAAFLAGLHADFYAEKVASGALPEAELASALFATTPGAGAALLALP